jgi:GTP-binding protein EngB required for normal cell division
MGSHFKAAKSRSQGRKAWSIIFYHPLRRDPRGKPLRVRRGLGTDNEAEADQLIGEMNRLLGDESYWTLAAKERALRDIDPKIVSFFYDDIESRQNDPWVVRDSEIPLPSRHDGYSRVLFLGTTGAGKTTLVRQLIGSEPKLERFPSTSTAKTTIFDIEIIFSTPPYRAVVSFLSRDKIRHYLSECIVAAVSTAAEGGKEEEIARRLLEHAEQRFRMSYMLGTLPIEKGEEEEEEPVEEDDDESIDGTSSVTTEEKARLEMRLRSYINRIKVIAESARKELLGTLGLEEKILTTEDRDAFLELLEDYVLEKEEAQLLMDDIEEDIESRFQLLESGSIEKDRSGWPVRWSFETGDRSLFIKAINPFSSNYAKNFGRLLTPLVQGLRVSGPFQPLWSQNKDMPKLVLMDTEGLGHTPGSASSLPTYITKRFEAVDVILLVDSATQPMVAGAQAVLRNVVASGHDSKLVIVFTHFDQVRGDNLPNELSKRNHVKASLENAIRGIEESLGTGAGRRLLHQTENRVFFLSNIDQFEIPKKRTKEQLNSLVDTLHSAILPPPPVQAIPVYDLGNLILAIQSATMKFHEQWHSRLPSEHWTRVKALTRRLAYLGEDHYDDLMPVADLIRYLQEAIRAYIGKPREWKPAKPSDEMCDVAINLVAQEFFSRLHQMVPDRLWLEYLKDWQHAYDLRGLGTGNARKEEIKSIYANAAPIPTAVPSLQMSRFLDSVRSLFREAATASGGEVI